ncbi:hypothetical protein AWB80_07862 [Caballeronia pedi]|uniref:Uncharacterized protein n=1 Tax=Caballeronia pedi TaxID=1777141 RepID=A0A158E0Q9_9BURK|nr:hypothetical protein AWB80_07862 [Caballeronia pedi]
MEKAQGRAAFLEERDERQFRAIQLPVRREKAAVLVAVRVTEHHFLLVALILDELVDARQREELAHDDRRIAQVGDGLEQRNDHQAVVRGIVLGAETALQHARFLLQQHHFEQIADGFRVRDDVVAHRARAELRARFVGGFEHAEFALREIGVLRVGNAQRTRLREFLQQHLALLLFGKRRVIRDDARAREQLRDDRLVNVRTLPQVDAREMEAEHLGGARERRQTQDRHRRAMMFRERIDQHMQVAREFGGVGVRLRANLRRARPRAAHGDDAFAQPHARARREPRVNADERPPIRLVGAMRRLIRRGIGECFQRIARTGEQVRHGQFRAELVHLFQIVLEDDDRLAGDRGFERLAGDERIAVAIAADPASHLKERRQAHGQAVFGERAFDIGVERGNLREESRAIVRQRVVDFIGDGEARVAQHARLPQRCHARAQHCRVLCAFAVGQFLVALGEQARDVVLRIENALARHFGRMRGEDGHDERIAEEFVEQLARGTDVLVLTHALDRIGDGARLGA